jgi:hypothetical protein
VPVFFSYLASFGLKKTAVFSTAFHPPVVIAP